MTTLELIAVEVLRGNMAAARGMLDLLTEEESNGIRLPPVKHIKVDVAKIRVVLFFSDAAVLHGDIQVDIPVMIQAVNNWLEKGGPLLLYGVDRIELYEML